MLLKQALTVDDSRFLPETKGRSLEEMDIIFGSVNAEKREADIQKQARGVFGCYFQHNLL